MTLKGDFEFSFWKRFPVCLIATLRINNFWQDFILSLYIDKPNSSESIKEIWRLRKLLPSKRKNKERRNSSTLMMLGTTNYFTDCFTIGVLVNVEKKIVCLQCGLKNWRELRDIDCNYDIILQKHSLM